MGVWMLKKYIYVGILLGAIVLAGCTVNEVTEKQVQVKEEITEDVANGQAVEVETLFKNDNKVVSVISLDLTQKHKEDYYKQYGEIIKEVNSEYDADLELEPFDHFLSNEEWWVESEDFRQIAIDMATAEFTSKVFGGDPVE